MKKITLYLVFVLAQPILLQAQYAGGNGRGDASLESLNILMNSGNTHHTVSATYSMQQNCPNPFNAATSIKFNITKSTEVKLVVYDITGRVIETLVNESLQPGTHTVSFDGSALKSGVFLYRITAGDYCETRRMVLEK